MTTFDEAEFLRLYREYPQEAFKQMMEGYRDRIFIFCKRVTKTDEDAEDLAQDVFVRIWKGLRRFEGRSSLKTWIFRIAWNVCASYLEKKGRQPNMMTYKEDENDDDDDYFSEKPLIKPEAEHFEKRQLISILFSMIPASHRLVLTLYYMQELNYNEISEITGWPMGTVKATLFRAKSKMKEAAEIEANRANIRA